MKKVLVIGAVAVGVLALAAVTAGYVMQTVAMDKVEITESQDEE